MGKPEPRDLGREPIILTKLGNTIFDKFLHHSVSDQANMIGDSTAIDIKFGKNNGI